MLWAEDTARAKAVWRQGAGSFSRTYRRVSWRRCREQSFSSKVTHGKRQNWDIKPVSPTLVSELFAFLLCSLHSALG